MAERLRHAAREVGKAAATVAVAIGLVFSPMNDSIAQNKPKPSTQSALTPQQEHICVSNLAKSEATEKQKKACSEAVGLLIEKTGANSSYALDLFESLVPQPFPKIKILGAKEYHAEPPPLDNLFNTVFIEKLAETINIVVEKSGKEQSSTVHCLQYVIQNENFKPEALDILNKIAEKSDGNLREMVILFGAMVGNPSFKSTLYSPDFVTKLDFVGTFANFASIIIGEKGKNLEKYYDLNPAEGLMKNPAFRPNMLNAAFAENFAGVAKAFKATVNAKVDAEDASVAFSDFLENPNVDPNKVNKSLAEKFAAALNEAADGVIVVEDVSYPCGSSCLSAFRDLVKNPKFKPDMLSFVEMLVEENAEDGPWGMEVLDNLLKNPNFEPHMFYLLNRIIEKADEPTAAMLSLNSVLESPNFKPAMLAAINTLVEKDGLDPAYTLRVFGNILNYSNPDSEISGYELAEKISETLTFINEETGVNGPDALSIFLSLTKKPDFAQKLFAPKFATEFSALVNAVAEKSGEYREQTFDALAGVARSPKFSPDMFDTLVLMAVKRNLDSFRVVFYVYEIMDKYKFSPAVSGTLSLLASKTDDSAAWNALYSFKTLYENPNFQPDMLKTVNSLIENSGQNVPYALDAFGGILSNPNFKPKIKGNGPTIKLLITPEEKPKGKTQKFNQSAFDGKFAENFAYIVNYIAEKHGENAGYALANFAELMKNPKFKPGMLRKDSDVIISLIVEKMGTPNENSIPILLELLENPASKVKMSDEFAEKFQKAMAIFAEQDNDDAQRALHIFEHLAGQKKLKPEILDLVILAIEKNKTNSVGTITAFCDILTSHGSGPNTMQALKFIVENYSVDSKGWSGHAAKPLKALGALLNNPDVKLEMLKNLEDAKKLVGSYEELDKTDAEILMNFAYALAVLGEEKTKALYEKNSIEYFGRYRKSMLEELYLTSTDLEHKKDSPLLVAVFNKNDWNNSFYYSGRTLGKLTKHYRVVLFEADSESEFYKKIEATEKTYGKIDSLVVAGHGSTKTVNLGYGWDSGDIDTSDEKDLEKMKDHFVENPNVILIACSSASDETSIAAMLSKLWNAKAWGENKTSSLSYFKLDEKGKIIKPVYEDNSGNQFINGKLVEQPQK
ncbi:hypothetical protein H0O02_04475 [Candidatus Micrarchaeota archaeon]|nr:hypothetical protein [Candidatus Micrarchaeota archaeon]